MKNNESSFTRRDFVKTGAAAGAAAWAASPVLSAVGGYVGGSDTLRIGLIGCGGRGTGAAFDALNASPGARVVAIGDVFKDRMEGSRGHLRNNFKDRADVPDDHCHVGFDAYKQVIASDIDTVILATPPHFRPDQFLAAIDAGKHVFMEKPVAVDPVGIRKVIKGGQQADEKGLSVVAGTQRRHEQVYLELMKRLKDGAIGEICAGRVSWNQNGLWVKKQQSDWSDMEWQIRNWLYFTWLSGDHIVEQHVHNLDVANWVMGGHPEKCLALGGRQTRTAPEYGHIYDHFAVEFDYGDGRFVESFSRQQNGCDNRVSEGFVGNNGHSWSSSGWALIRGANEWRFEGNNPNPYVVEHKDLHASIRGETERLNEAQRIAESTLTAIMGRMSAYTGKEVTWEDALNSKLSLGPDAYAWGDLPVPAVAEPGKTPLI